MVGFHGFSSYFRGFWFVSIVVHGFHSFRVVSMVFQGGFMVFGQFPWFFKVVSWFSMVFGWFPWFFKVVSWFFMVFALFTWFSPIYLKLMLQSQQCYHIYAYFLSSHFRFAEKHKGLEWRAVC